MSSSLTPTVERQKWDWYPSQKNTKSCSEGFMYLRTIWRRLKLKNSNSAGRPQWKKVKLMKKKYNYTGPTRYESLDQINEAIQKAADTYNFFRPKAQEFRDKYRRQLAPEIAEDTGRKMILPVPHDEAKFYNGCLDTI